MRNAGDVRAILESAGNVLAVFQGHYHAGGYSEIEGIHYCTLKALVEGPAPDTNAYAFVSIFPDSSMRVEGFGQQTDHNLDGRTEDA